MPCADEMAECGAKDDATSAAVEDSRAAPSNQRERQDNDAVERNLALSERVWKEKTSRCPGGIAPADEPLTLLLSKLSQ